MKGGGSTGHSAKHSGTGKHTQGKGKHHPKSKPKAASGHHAASGTNPVHVVARHHKAAKARGVSLAGVACCPAEAVAESARLAGWAVTGEDVLDLYARCADGPTGGFTIAAALTSASRFGLGTATPVGVFEPLDLEASGVHVTMPVVLGAEQDPMVAAATSKHALDRQPGPAGVPGSPLLGEHLTHALILGVDLPGPHAVTVAPDGTWWSWGKPFDPAGWPGLVVEEAWAVSFA